MQHAAVKHPRQGRGGGGMYYDLMDQSAAPGVPALPLIAAVQ